MNQYVWITTCENNPIRLWDWRRNAQGTFVISYCGVPIFHIEQAMGYGWEMKFKSADQDFPVFWHAVMDRSRDLEGLKDSKAFPAELAANEWFASPTEILRIDNGADKLEGVCRHILKSFPASIDSIKFDLGNAFASESNQDVVGFDPSVSMMHHLKSRIFLRTHNKNLDKLSAQDVWSEHPIVYIKAS